MLSTLPGAERLIQKLLSAILGLDAANELPSHPGSSRNSLSQDLADLYNLVPAGVNARAVGILLERVIKQPDDEELIWSAVYGLLAPSTPPRKRSITPKPNRDILHDLQNDWVGDYAPDSLVALQRLVNYYTENARMTDYYSKMLVFVQSSGLGKSRLGDMFGKSCPMINFVLRGERTRGYPPPDGEILKFMRMELSEIPSDDRGLILESPRRKGSSHLDETAAAIWNHSIAAGLLQACFEECKLVHVIMLEVTG